MTQIGRTSARVSIEAASAPGGRVVLSWAAVSDTGKKRAANEDSSLSQPPLFAVADGMGGHSAGDVASAAVVERLGRISGDTTDAEAIETALALALGDIDRVGDASVLGTGTTVTGVALAEADGVPSWLVFNIGDSRTYLFEDGELTQVTVDHSVVQELVDAGLITREQAETHPDSNVITRAVGFHEKPVPDYETVPLRLGQRVLVCSDGLTKELTEHGIGHYLATAGTAVQAADDLVAAALANGGRDNVTVVVIDVETDDGSAQTAADTAVVEDEVDEEGSPTAPVPLASDEREAQDAPGSAETAEVRRRRLFRR